MLFGLGVEYKPRPWWNILTFILLKKREQNIKGLFVSVVKKIGKIFYTLEGVWVCMKIRSNWKWISVDCKIESLTTENQLQFYFTFKPFPPQKISLLTHSHHSRQVQAEGRRELSPVKPRSSPRPTAPPVWSHRSNPSPIWSCRLSFFVMLKPISDEPS